ncbi:type I-E CRISPR-associated protein Cse2/CasB [Methylocaldum sp.]|uniref:type I-E CRISPR-associated protein Cse2/CasB n=1 Tax=Methylocaldum sp. TaxID=1969727 RepID=UPI002D6D6407|nr:type I-E CRISPR-associated protein Cse2/CasB [Methylocaldum sp.]HYE36207.1 type I-E CRISPR-associated protein Cse2/CasB [Methylocaldum sp.]
METSPDTRKEKRKLFDAIVTEWWKEMQPTSEAEGQPNRRGELAELKRCKTLAEILLVPRFQALLWRLRKAGCDVQYKEPAIAAVAGILTRVKQTTDLKFPAWLAQSKANGEPRVGELRFRRLASCGSLEEMFPALIRVLPLADETAPVAALAHDLYSWSERTRQRWTMEYYEALLTEEEKTGKAAKS